MLFGKRDAVLLLIPILQPWTFALPRLFAPQLFQQFCFPVLAILALHRGPLAAFQVAQLLRSEMQMATTVTMQTLVRLAILRAITKLLARATHKFPAAITRMGKNIAVKSNQAGTRATCVALVRLGGFGTIFAFHRLGGFRTILAF